MNTHIAKAAILALATLLTSTARSQSCAPVTSGLIAWWPGDGNAQTLVGTNSGTIPDHADVSFGSGEVGQAFVFSGHSSTGNGNGNEVDFGTNIGNFGTNDFTVDFWIRTTNAGTSAVMEKRSYCGATLNEWNIRCGPVNYAPGSRAGQLSFNTSDNGGALINHFASQKSVNDGKFHHAAFVRQSSTNFIYIDGVLDSSNAISGVANLTNSSMLRIGNSVCVGSDGTVPFAGELDEADLFGRALNPDEIYAIYAAGSAGKCDASQSCAPVTAGLVAWWPGDGNADAAIGTNSGTIPDPVNVTFGPGKVGEAFVFSGHSPSGNGSGNEVDFGTNVGNFGTNDFTVDFWIQSTNTGTSAVMEKRSFCDASLNEWNVRMGPVNYAAGSQPGQLSFNTSDNGSTLINHFASHKIVNDGAFHHAAFVRQGSTNFIYIDGALDSSNVIPGIANLANPSVLRIGNSACVDIDGTGPFEGALDEIDLFDRALEPGEVYAIYSAGSGGKCGTPVIVSQPQSLIVSACSNATFTVGAALAANYQWTFDGADIAGATSSTLVISNVNQTNLGTYAVVVSNAFGSVVSSNATLEMYPQIVAQFGGEITYWGQNATLSAVVWGTGPLTYQWYDNGYAITGATNLSFTLTNVHATNAGFYSLVVTSPLGSVTNAPAEVVVEPAGVSLGLYPGVMINGTVGFSYVIQRTSDLSTANGWVSVANITLTQPTQLWVDTNINTTLPGNPQRYYIVVPSP